MILWSTPVLRKTSRYNKILFLVWQRSNANKNSAKTTTKKNPNPNTLLYPQAARNRQKHGRVIKEEFRSFHRNFMLLWGTPKLTQFSPTNFVFLLLILLSTEHRREFENREQRTFMREQTKTSQLLHAEASYQKLLFNATLNLPLSLRVWAKKSEATCSECWFYMEWSTWFKYV